MKEIILYFQVNKLISGVVIALLAEAILLIPVLIISGYFKIWPKVCKLGERLKSIEDKLDKKVKND